MLLCHDPNDAMTPNAALNLHLIGTTYLSGAYLHDRTPRAPGSRKYMPDPPPLRQASKAYAERADPGPQATPARVRIAALYQR